MAARASRQVRYKIAVALALATGFLLGPAALALPPLPGGAPYVGVVQSGAPAGPKAMPNIGYRSALSVLGAAAPGGSKAFGIDFICPKSSGQPDQEVFVDATVCPQYMVDREDVMGQPALVIDPQNPALIAFHALHGGVGIHLPEPYEPAPPTPRARWDFLHQPHTTWQTFDGGSQWKDGRYHAPGSIAGHETFNETTVYGLDNAIALDASGRAYLASIYAYYGKGENTYHYVISTWKNSRLDRAMDYNTNNVILHRDDAKEGITSENPVRDIWLSYAPDTNRIVLFWLENAATNKTLLGQKTSWIEMYWTDPAEGGLWNRVNPGQDVGPCQGIARPVAYRHQIFFGCLPDQGYNYEGVTSSIGTWQIHALDTHTWRTHRVADTGVHGENGMLLDFAQTGHQLFLGSGIDTEHHPRVIIAKGSLGENWTRPSDFGDKFLPDSGQTEALSDVRATAAVYTPETGYIHILLQKRLGNGRDPSRLAAGETTSFNKTYAVVRWAGTDVEWVGKFDGLRYGGVRGAATLARASAAYQGLDDRIFDDLHDGLVVWHDPDQKRERIFIAFDEEGAVRFAEVRQQNALPAVLLPPVDVPALPLALAQSTANANGAIVGLLSALVLLRMLTAKKKHANAIADK